MKDNDGGLACRVVCYGSLVLLGWWLRGSLGAKAAQQAGGPNAAPQDDGANPPARRAFTLDAVPVASAAPVTGADLMAKRSASAPVDFAEPPTLPKPYANHTAAASMLGHDPTLASQASAAKLSKGSVLDADG
jgi:hypothetical protein